MEKLRDDYESRTRSDATVHDLYTKLEEEETKSSASLSTIKESYEREIPDMKEMNEGTYCIGAVAAAIMAAKMKIFRAMRSLRKPINRYHKSIAPQGLSEIFRVTTVFSISPPQAQHPCGNVLVFTRVVLCVKCEIPVGNTSGAGIHGICSEKLLLKYLDSLKHESCFDVRTRACVCVWTMSDLWDTYEI